MENLVENVVGNVVGNVVVVEIEWFGEGGEK